MLGTDLQTFAAELGVALSVSASIEARDLVLPGILVTPGPIAFDRLDGQTVDLDVELLLVAGDTNPVTALDELTDLLLKLRAYLGNAPSVAEPMTVNLPSQSPDPLPALRCPIPLTLTFN